MLILNKQKYWGLQFFFAILVYNMANKTRNTQRKTLRKTLRNKNKKTQQRNKMRGGQFSMPNSKFYPQNTFEHDPSREISSSVLKGGKKHSRKYLRGGNSGFFSQFGSPWGASQVSEQITGVQPSEPILRSSYMV